MRIGEHLSEIDIVAEVEHKGAALQFVGKRVGQSGAGGQI
jgi:hypothetical protein